MNTLEQDLRRELAQAGDTAEARAAVARDEALRALASGARRARVRRLASIAGAGLSIAGIGVVLVLALPRGAEDGAPSGNTVAAKPFPSVSVLDRPATNEDRLLDAGDAGDFVDLGTARRVGATSQGRFFAVRGTGPGGFCVLVTRRRPSRVGVVDPRTIDRTVASGCVGPGELEHEGIVVAWQVRGSETHIGAIVPDGITAVRLGPRTIPVRRNAFAVVWPGSVPSEITLIGPAAAWVSDPDWDRSRLRDGTPTVTVLFAPGAAPRPPAPVPAAPTVPAAPVTPAPVPAPSAVLRGHSVRAVVAAPAGRRLTRGGVAIPAATDMAWQVTVLNGGDFVESNVRVAAVFRYPGAKPIVRRTTVRTEPGKPFTVRFRGPAVDALLLGVRGTLDVRVAPVQGERNTGNNRVVYPVTITFG